MTSSFQQLKKLTDFRIWLLVGPCILDMAASLLRVPLMPTHDDFPQFVAKKNHDQEHQNHVHG